MEQIGDDTSLLYEKIKDYFQKEDFQNAEKGTR